MRAFSILVLCASILVAHANLSCCDQNTLSIVGAGSVEVDPDIVQFSVSATEKGKTSSIALSKVNQKISQVTQVLKTFGLPPSNYSTSYLSINPQYRYQNGTSYLVGQQASQSLQVTLGFLTQNKQIIGQIAVALSAIDGISLSGFTFSNQDSSKAYQVARQAAVADAVAKVKQYSLLSGQSLGAVRKVVDLNTEQYIPFVRDAALYPFQAKLEVESGKVSVQASVQIDWKIAC